MAPTTIAAWEPFPIQSAFSPPLYIQRRFTTTSYTIYLTDLTSIWAESLDQGAICDRAEDRNCSIDPSTDDSQFQILLEKLAAGVTGLNPSVTVDLEVRSDTFNINTKEKLQAPLQPLEWRFRLKLQSGAVFTKHFSLPLLYYGSLLSRQTNSLLTIIDEKDATIARLLDKFEEYKFDLSSIFPGYKKGRTPQGKAKGLVPFDRNAWRQELQAAEFESKASKELVKTTFYQLARKEEKIEISLPKAPEAQWWKKLSGKTTVKGEPEAERTPFTTPKKPPPKTVRINTDSDDDFQALPSSPIRASAVEPEVPTKTPLDDETTDDEDDNLMNVIPTGGSRSTSTSQNTPLPTKGSVSPIRLETKSTSPRPAVKKEPQDRQSKFEENFRSQMGFLDSLVEYDETTSDSETEAPKPKKVALAAGKTGGIKKTIGGRKQEQPKPPQDDLEDSSMPPAEPKVEEETEAPKRLGKIKGTIGSRKPGAEPAKRKEPEPDSDEEMVDPEPEAPKPPPKKKAKSKSPPIQGMDEDAAQKRREDLQRQLASKAAGKKRGRKF
ncbi:hypothetical protein AOL_s00080g175 [Orbilia oligospora ATCC 24927]|uniref:Non-homologous end-joining factor 1 n=1 Tax=Arthrobotrys oligospora (strain ATCC 24927 / CBS 115.81 / DSM 1491) TaxID=756982 RepID=G1XEE0_ARTOA|nr:hypothetical protein AOL_s00080g175 [Orbilia oligospora ATCC 24927]EGX48546.1 hypothetical protein AOL_s00080g175 [Orbilia oligospora ATCC 24927]